MPPNYNRVLKEIMKNEYQQILTTQSMCSQMLLGKWQFARLLFPLKF